MPGKKVRLDSDDGRWLEMTVGRGRATARVGKADDAGEPFPFNFEHLSFVPRGMGYQAWGSGSHFTFRTGSRGFAVEFQGPNDRSAAVAYLSEEEIERLLDELDALRPSETRARLL
ncbi:hypothetical protein EON82_16780 [bacterium]|nr:MAG: hypothetical protein EON82_16780 [bacterium]